MPDATCSASAELSSLWMPDPSQPPEQLLLSEEGPKTLFKALIYEVVSLQS
jgi:hypothetical protein